MTAGGGLTMLRSREEGAAVLYAPSETRLRILEILAERPRGVCDLARLLGVNKSAVHKHLLRLVGAGLLLRTESRRWVYYRLTPAARAFLAAPPPLFFRPAPPNAEPPRDVERTGIVAAPVGPGLPGS